MTVPQYNVKGSNIVGRKGNGQSTVDIPPHGIFIDVSPGCLISLFAANDVVVEGFLPDCFSRHGLMQFLTDRSFVLTDNDREVLSDISRCITKNDNGMDVIGHDHEFVNNYVAKVFGDVRKKLGGYLTESVQLICCTENAFFLVRADGDEIIIRQRIVVLRYAIGFAFGMVHDGTSLRIRRSVCGISRTHSAERS